MNELLTLEVLTPDRITELLAEKRTRGEYREVCETFAESGELAYNLSARFPGKDFAAIKQSVNGNITKHGKDWPAMTTLVQTVGDVEVLWLVNTVVHAAAVAAAVKVAADSE